MKGSGCYFDLELHTMFDLNNDAGIHTIQGDFLIIFSQSIPVFVLGLSLGGNTGTNNLLGGVDQGTLAALKQQQMIQQQLKAIANTPFGDSPLFRNLPVSLALLFSQYLFRDD